MSDTYLGATEGELLGAPLARRLHRRVPAQPGRGHPRQQPGSPVGAGATHAVLCGGVRVMRRRLTAALILAALIVVCISGCHFRVTVHAGPALHGSAAGR